MLIAPMVVRNQRKLPACEGESLAFALERGTFVPSGRFLWVSARAYQGNLAHPEDGTSFDAVLWAAQNIGIASFDPTEADDSPKNWSIVRLGEELEESLEADDHRVQLKASFINPLAEDAFDLVCAALESGHRCTFASGLREPFFGIEAGEVVTEKHVGGDVDGHAQAVCGFDKMTRELFVLNSWGDDWGGLVVEKEQFPGPNWPGQIDAGENWVLPGAYRMAAGALGQIWEVYAVEVVS